MEIRFNSLNRFEVPKFYLCSPGSVYQDGMLTNIVGILSDTTDEEIVTNFNATSELNFRVNRVRRADAEENEYVYKLYRSLQNRRLIFVDDVGYFVITQVDDGYADGQYYKDIRAESVEVEIQNKALTYIEDGTYKFTDLIEKIVSTLPLWTIGEVAPTIAERHRTFQDVSVELNTLAFLQENVQDAYECIIVYDTINRQINVYDQNDYVRLTDIHITKDDLINSIDISESSDDLYTAISVMGDENLTIAPINPLGTTVIYDFSYYLDWMTPELKPRVQQWQELVDSYMEEYYDLNLQYYELLTTQSNLNSNLDKLDIQLTMYRRCRENIVAENSTESVVEYNEVIAENGGTEITIHDNVEDTIAEIDNLIALAEDEYSDTELELTKVDEQMASLNESIELIHNAVAITEFFTQEEYTELYNYIYEGSYTDEYITVTDSMTYSERFDQMKLLYDRAVTQLERVSKPTQEFTIDVENFIFVSEFKDWSDQLETGCLINVELDVNDVAALFLSNMTVNYDDHSLKMTFGNRFNKFDPKTLFENALGNIQKTSNTIDYIKEILYPISNGEFNSMKEALANSRTLTKNAVLSSTNEEVIIDDTGYTGRRLLDNGTYDPRQVKLTGRAMVFTDDAWETCKVALGEIILGDDQTCYGINAETIIGDVIMGNNLRILDNEGNDLLKVVDGMIQGTVRDYDESKAEVWTQVTQTAEQVDILVNTEVDSVTTTTGYTFDSEGLTIHKDGEEITNLLDNTGMYVKRGEEAILTANNQGVDAINLTARQYLIVGANTRFENYSTDEDPNRTGCFYIGP